MPSNRLFPLPKSLSLHFLSIKIQLFSTFSSAAIPLKKSCIIFHLKHCKSFQHLTQIQPYIFKLGLHQDQDTNKKILSFLTNPSPHNLRYSEKIFNFVERRCLFTYNVMLKTLVGNNCFRKAVLLFNELRLQNLVVPDNFTYPFVFKAIGRIRDVREGEKMHGFVIKNGAYFDCYVCNSLMDMYSELGSLDVTTKIFDGMTERDTVAWNVLIKSYSRGERFEDAVKVYQRMRKEGANPDERTVASTLSACSELKDLELGKEIHRYVSEVLGFTSIIENALLNIYGKCGCLDLARKIFDGMKVRNVICWTAMVSAYVKCGDLDEARVLFDRSPVRDLILWTTMINGYVQFNRFDEAAELFKEMQVQKVRPDNFTLVSLLTGCAQIGALEQGKWIRGYIDENGISVDAVVGTALIEMYAKCGCIEKSVEIFDGLKGRDTASWTSIICGLAVHGKTRQALDYFLEMTQAGFRPDDITFIGVLSACCHGGLVEEGRKYFYSMKTVYGIEPKSEHYGCMIDLLGRAGLLDEAEEMMEKLPDDDNKFIIPLYGALLSASRVHGNVDLGERISIRLAGIQSRDSGVLTLIANIYASAGRWQDVTKVRRRMKALGVKKFPGCSSIEVSGTVHEFLVGDSSHLKIGEIYCMLDRLAIPLLGSEENETETENLFDDCSCLNSVNS